MRISDRLARFNRAFPNRVVGVFAGGRLSPVALVEHGGRKSGQPYRTPVVAFRVPGGYVVTLPYGAERDWVRNVRAAGRCVLRSGGRRMEMTAPRVVAAEQATASLPVVVRAGLRLLPVRRVLRLTRSNAGE